MDLNTNTFDKFDLSDIDYKNKPDNIKFFKYIDKLEEYRRSIEPILITHDEMKIYDENQKVYAIGNKNKCIETIVKNAVNNYLYIFHEEHNAISFANMRHDFSKSKQLNL